MQITLRDITLAYDKQLATLNHFNAQLPAGQLTALLGPSGSGKSTLLNLLAGLLTPNAGQIYFDQVDVTHQDSRQRNIGMVFQDYALYPHLTVRDNIAFPLKMAHVHKAARYQRVAELAELVQMTDQLTKFPGQLSGGQQQRVAIARALAKEPALLLLDEPLSSLDTTLREDLRGGIRRIQRATGVTTLLVTHDQDDALQIADQIMIIADGHLQQVGTGNELYRQPRNLTVAQSIGQPRLNTCDVTALPAAWRQVLPLEPLRQATTIGIRSEALQLAAPTAPHTVVSTISRQVQLGRDHQTTLHTTSLTLVSTAITAVSPTPISVALDPTECLLFAADGRCLWAGDAHA